MLRHFLEWLRPKREQTPEDIAARAEAERLRQEQQTIRAAARDAPPGFKGDQKDIGRR
jgi:hypothetical protein